MIKNTIAEFEKQIEGIESKKYFDEMKHRYEFTLNIIKTLVPNGQKILDIGSSPGFFTAMVKKLNHDVVAIDLFPEVNFVSNEKSQDFWQKYNIPIVKSDVNVDRLPFRDNSFDMILFTEILEHLYLYPNKTLLEIKRVLKDDGYLILSTPNVSSLFNRIKFLMGINIYNSIEIMCNLSIHKRHNREYNFSEIKNLLNLVGLSIEKKYFLTFNKSNKYTEKILKFLFRIVIFFFPQIASEIFIIAKKRKN